MRSAVAALVVTVAACREPNAGEVRVHERWFQPQAGEGWARPGITPNGIAFGTGDARVVMRDAVTGRAIWSTAVGDGPVWGANMISRQGAVMVAVQHSTVALDANTGAICWRYYAPVDSLAGSTDAGQVIRSHLDADSSTVFIPAWGASVSAVDVATGSTRWIWQPGRAMTDTAARMYRSGSEGVRVSGDTVYATAWHSLDDAGLVSEGWVVALDRLTGRELWRITIPPFTGGAFFHGAPVIYGRLIIFAIKGGHEYAFDRFTQQPVWEFTPSPRNATYAQTEIYEGVVFHDGADQFLYALKASDGTLLWRAPFSSMTTRDMLVTPRRVIFSDGGSLYVLDRITGAQIARVYQPRTADSFFASPPARTNSDAAGVSRSLPA